MSLTSDEVAWLQRDGTLTAYLTMVDVMHLLDAGEFQRARELAEFETRCLLTLAQTAAAPRT